MPIIVVAAVLEREERILVTRRNPGVHQALKWEFPGGKLEKGETPEQALSRELQEELDIRCEVLNVYDVKLHAYADREVLVLFYHTRLLSGEPRPVDCSELMWARAEQLPSLDFADADAPVAARLARECVKNDN